MLEKTHTRLKNATSQEHLFPLSTVRLLLRGNKFGHTLKKDRRQKDACRPQFFHIPQIFWAKMRVRVAGEKEKTMKKISGAGK